METNWDLMGIANYKPILYHDEYKINWYASRVNLDINFKQLDDKNTNYTIKEFVNSWFILPNDNKKDTLPTKHRLFEPKLLRCITDFLLYKIKS